jgi:hypothetical protein
MCTASLAHDRRLSMALLQLKKTCYLCFLANTHVLLFSCLSERNCDLHSCAEYWQSDMR